MSKNKATPSAGTPGEDDKRPLIITGPRGRTVELFEESETQMFAVSWEAQIVRRLRAVRAELVLHLTYTPFRVFQSLVSILKANRQKAKRLR